jgi:hypothetical protein
VTSRALSERGMNEMRMAYAWAVKEAHATGYRHRVSFHPLTRHWCVNVLGRM